MALKVSPLEEQITLCQKKIADNAREREILDAQLTALLAARGPEGNQANAATAPKTRKKRATKAEMEARRAKTALPSTNGSGELTLDA